MEDGYNTLRIIDVGLVDAGKYSCKFSNVLATNSTVNARVSVYGEIFLSIMYNIIRYILF